MPDKKTERIIVLPNDYYDLRRTMRDIRLHTLIGDIQRYATDGMSETGIRGLLKSRHVHEDSDITKDVFEQILNEQYNKVLKWRAEKGQE